MMQKNVGVPPQDARVSMHIAFSVGITLKCHGHHMEHSGLFSFAVQGRRFQLVASCSS